MESPKKTKKGVVRNTREVALSSTGFYVYEQGHAKPCGGLHLGRAARVSSLPIIAQRPPHCSKPPTWGAGAGPSRSQTARSKRWRHRGRGAEGQRGELGVGPVLGACRTGAREVGGKESARHSAMYHRLEVCRGGLQRRYSGGIFLGLGWSQIQGAGIVVLLFFITYSVIT